MLKVTSIQRPKGDAWEKEHIINVIYCATTENESDILSVLHAESFADSARFSDGARLENIARGLRMEATDANGNIKSVPCLVENSGVIDWNATFSNVSNVLVGVTDPTAFAFHVSAADIMGDPSVVALVPTKSPDIEIANVPCIGHGKTEEEARAKAIEKQTARWKQRVAKGRASVRRAAATATAE